MTILFTMICALLAFSVLRWSVTERRLNSRGALWLSARNATEGLAEYGFSQVRNDFETKSTPGIFKPGTANALNLPNASVFTGSSVVTGALSNSNPYGMELIGGPVTQIPNTGASYFIDPADYSNQFDPLKGKWIFRQDIQIIARASVSGTNGNPITHYVTETISVRGAPLFAHAIFYNGDLELNPGPQMDLYGPVHTNGNLFVSNQSDSGGLNFHGTVTCAGNVYHSWAGTTAVSHEANQTIGENPVTFLNASGNQTNMKASSATTSWKDSTMGASAGVSGTTSLAALVTSSVSTSFRQYAAATWGGNLLTGASGILPYNPISFNQVIDAAGNHPDPSVLIDAPAPPLSSDTYYAAKMEVEAQKKSMLSGLYIKVTVNSSGAATISFYGHANSAPGGTAAAQVGPNGGYLLNPPANVANAPSAATPPLVAYLPFRKKVAVTSGSGSSKSRTTTVYNSAGTVVTVSGVSGTVTGVTGTNGTVTTILTDASTGTFGYGMYDQRRGLSTSGTNAGGNTDIVQIDMRALRALVDAMASSSTTTGDANVLTYTDPADSVVKVWNNANAVTSGLASATQTSGAEKLPWNGAVFIAVQAPNSGTSSQTVAVRLVNGTVASGSSLIPSYGPYSTGLSISTNAPLYIYGHLNADGVITTSSSSTPDDGQDGSSGHASTESPLSLAADAITVLSPGWSDANSFALKPVVTGDCEIAAAFLTAYVGTNAAAYSGGAHNLPRFLEDWSNRVVSIRGSMVALFNSRIATQPWTLSYYGAPDRNWGFNSTLKNGNYPPFTPKVMSYRRVDFSDLTAAQYAARKAAMWP